MHIGSKSLIRSWNNDVQKLVGDIQWIRTWCGITNTELELLLQLLQDSTDPSQPRSLMPEAKKALLLIENKLSHTQTYQYDPHWSIDLAVYHQSKEVSVLIMQTPRGNMHILEWIFFPARPHMSVLALPEWLGSLSLQLLQEGMDVCSTPRASCTSSFFLRKKRTAHRQTCCCTHIPKAGLCIALEPARGESRAGALSSEVTDTPGVGSGQGQQQEPQEDASSPSKAE